MFDCSRAESGRCSCNSCRSSAVRFELFISSQLSLSSERKLVAKLFGKLRVSELYGKVLAKGMFTQALFLDSFLAHLSANLMLLLD